MAKKSFMDSMKVESSLVRDVERQQERDNGCKKELARPFALSVRPSLMTELRIFAAENGLRGGSSVFTSIIEKFIDVDGKLRKEELKEFLGL